MREYPKNIAEVADLVMDLVDEALTLGDETTAVELGKARDILMAVADRVDTVRK